MVRIAELSKDVAKDYREVKKTKLQRTFVSAKNAAESKAQRTFYFYKNIYTSTTFIHNNTNFL